MSRKFTLKCCAGQESNVSAFNSLHAFIDRRLEALVAILFPSAADPAVCSALLALGNGASDFTCKAFVRASIAVPLISRFTIALLRCAMEAAKTEIYWNLHEELLEAACSCLRMAFKSLDDALRIVANSPRGLADLDRCSFLCQTCTGGDYN